MGYDNDWYDKPKPLRKPKSNIVTFQIQPNHHLIPIKAHNPPINPPFHSLSLSFCKEEEKKSNKRKFLSFVFHHFLSIQTQKELYIISPGASQLHKITITTARQFKTPWGSYPSSSSHQCRLHRSCS